LKLQPDRIEGVNVVSNLSADSVSVNGVRHLSSIVVPWQGQVEPWGRTSVEQLSAEDFEKIAALGPELVIFGSGPRLRFPPAALMRPLIDKRIGMESMDTAAACRTYNVLVAEGRRVVAALLLG
jgi:uncharacterized protein